MLPKAPFHDSVSRYELKQSVGEDRPEGQGKTVALRSQSQNDGCYYEMAAQVLKAGPCHGLPAC